MPASTRFLPLFAAIAFAALGAQAQETTDGSDYHPLMMNSPVNPEVQAGAMAAARPAGTESIGQSTSAPAMASKVSDTDVLCRRGRRLACERHRTAGADHGADAAIGQHPLSGAR